MVMQVIFMVFSLFIAMVFLYIYPVLAKFYNSIKNTFRNAFLMAIRHLPYTVLMAVITLLPAGVFLIIIFRQMQIPRIQTFRTETLLKPHQQKMITQYDQMGRETIPLSGLYAERAVWRKGL